jgi:protein-tyrosine phosphatase
LSLYFGKEKIKWEFEQYQLYFWEDKTVPSLDYLEPLLSIVDFGRQLMKEHQRCLVHCSAGVGRTGVLLAMINLKTQYPSIQ